MQVVDEVERRVKRDAPDVPFVRLLRAANPAGTITLDSIQAVRSALEGVKPARVLIDGEEDCSPYRPSRPPPRFLPLLRAAGRGCGHGPDRRRGEGLGEADLREDEARVEPGKVCRGPGASRCSDAIVHWLVLT